MSYQELKDLLAEMNRQHGAPVDVDPLTRILVPPGGPLYTIPAGRWGRLFEEELEKAGADPGVLRRLVAGRRSLFARSDENVTWDVSTSHRERGHGGDITRTARIIGVSYRGEWTRRAWRGEAVIRVTTTTWGEVITEPVEGELLVASGQAEEVTAFTGRTIASWCAEAWGNHLLRVATDNILEEAEESGESQSADCEESAMTSREEFMATWRSRREFEDAPERVYPQPPEPKTPSRAEGELPDWDRELMEAAEARGR